MPEHGSLRAAHCGPRPAAAGLGVRTVGGAARPGGRRTLSDTSPGSGYFQSAAENPRAHGVRRPGGATVRGDG
jgi:hypothetical protein